MSCGPFLNIIFNVPFVPAMAIRDSANVQTAKPKKDWQLFEQRKGVAMILVYSSVYSDSSNVIEPYRYKL